MVWHNFCYLFEKLSNEEVSMKNIAFGFATIIAQISFSSFVVADETSTPQVPESLTSVSVDGYISDTVSAAWPEQKQVGAEFLDPVYDPNLVFTENS